MKQPLVVDASVALKWVLFEEFTNQARGLYEAALQARRPFLVPPHFFSEVTSALYQRTRTREPTRHLSEDEAYEAFVRFSRFHVQPAAPEQLYERAFVFARDHRLASLYDSIYVVLAQLMDIQLWTADRRLFSTASPVASWVRWIGDYRQP
jgi:predicted nucleic acid-binding protein